MGNRASTNSICNFPFTFEDQDAIEDRFDPAVEDQCTTTLGEFYGTGWDVVHFGFLFLYLAIYTPLIAFRWHKLRIFARIRNMEIKQTMQFNVFVHLSLMVLLQSIASIDVHGFDDIVAVEFYLVVTDLTLVFTLMIALYILDFLIKTSDVRFRRYGVSKKVIHFAFIFAILFYPGITILSIIKVEQYNTIIGIRRFLEALEALTFLLLSRYYKNKLVNKLDSLNFSAGKDKVTARINRNFFRYNCFMVFVFLLSLFLGATSLADDSALTYDTEDGATFLRIFLGRVFFALIPAVVLGLFRSPDTGNSNVSKLESSKRAVPQKGKGLAAATQRTKKTRRFQSYEESLSAGGAVETSYTSHVLVTSSNKLPYIAKKLTPPSAKMNRSKFDA